MPPEMPTPRAAADDEALFRRVRWRLAPPLIVLYLIAFLDRVNISFASLRMNRDLGLSESLFGFGAGIFFAGYLLFAVPANLLVERLGVRRGLALIMVAWGLLSGAMAFIHSGAMFVLLRFALGAAEAGFFPGVILYLTRWMPAPARARLNALFVLAVPLATVLGAPVSTWLLATGGLGPLRDWQLLFLAEALPAVLVGLCVPMLLADAPAGVRWLSAEEKARLQAALAADLPLAPVAAEPWHRTLRGPAGRHLLVQAALYFALSVGLYALGFWVPRILASRQVALTSLGWLTALPFFLGALGMLASSASSDHFRERRWHLAASFLFGALGIAFTSLTSSAPAAVIGLSVAAAGIFAILPVFWTAATQPMPPHTRAAGIAIINALGGLGGLLGPVVIGAVLDRTGSYRAGLLITAGCLLAGSALAAGLPDLPAGRPRPEKARA